MTTIIQIVQERNREFNMKFGSMRLNNNSAGVLSMLDTDNVFHGEKAQSFNLTTAIEILKAVKEMVGEEVDIRLLDIGEFSNSDEILGRNAEKYRLNSAIDEEIKRITSLQ